MLPDFRKDKWLDTAVSGIRFYLDRKNVRTELEGHIEDRTADLRRLFPDIPEREAYTRALAQMGDAEEVGRELARVHKPWLGWLWNASRWAVIALWFVCLAAGYRSNAFAVDRSLWGRGGAEFYGPVQSGEAARVGGYTFRITGAACLDRREETGAADTLQIVLRASSPWPWEKIDQDALLNSLYVTGPDGERRYMGWRMTQHYTIADELGNTTTHWQLSSGGGLCRWGLGWIEVALNVPAEGWTPGGLVTLELDSEAGEFILSVPVTEEVAIP